MYYYISGQLVLTEPNMAVVDAGGVGYQLSISATTLSVIASKIGAKVTLFTHFAVREDAMELYGFATQEELSAFRMLIAVSGVGAKSAISVLSQLSPDRFALAVATGDTKAISRASGIGAKTAARIVLELKDKIAKELPASAETDSEAAAAMQSGDDRGEAIDALLVLGYTRSEAIAALRGVEAGADLETMIRQALKKLMKN